MSVVIYRPGDAIPYTAEQLDDLCSTEGITPSDFLGEDWLESRYGLFYVDNDVPLGVAFCSVGKARGGKYMSLHVLCVSAGARKGGIGSKLLKHVEDLTKELKLQVVRLSAIANQVEFYKGNGFKDTRAKDGDSGYYPMEKSLSGGRRRAKTARIRRTRKKTLRMR